jgi:hypothetical protein
MALPRGRTECVPPRRRPSASSPGLSPQGPLPLDRPPRGGAGSARPQGRHRPGRDMCPVGQPASCLIIGWKRNASARVRPVFADARSASLRENRLSRRLQVLPPRPSVMRWPTPRRGGLRTVAMKELASPEPVPSRPPGVHLPPVIMICLGLRMAFPRGRTECLPPRKPPFASSPGPPP